MILTAVFVERVFKWRALYCKAKS